VRIAFVTEVWHPTVNGVVTRLSATVNQLRAMGHDVLIVAPGAEGVDQQLDGLTVRGVPTMSIRWVYGGQAWGLPVRRIGQYLADFGPDVVHVVNPASVGIAGVFYARRQGLPLVCSYHTDLTAYAGFYHLGWLRPLIRRALRALHAKADLNLVTSAAAGCQLAANGIEGVRLWAQGVDLDRFHPGKRIPGGQLTALYVGRLAAEKHLDALAQLAAVPGILLVVVGDGPARANVQAGLSGLDVDFRGVLEGDALARAYREADFFVFPSETETLGLVLLEALASGLPVVAAESPASREVLRSCPAARRWEPTRPGSLPAAIEELLGSASPSVLQTEARAHVEGVSWGRATAGLVGMYRTARATSQLSGGGRGEHRRRFGRFAAVGASNAAIDVGAFNLLAALLPSREPVQLAAYNTVAVALALANSYWWNSRWTFKQRQGSEWRWSTAHRRLLFAAQGLLNLAVNDAAVLVAATLLNGIGGLPAVGVANGSKVVGMVTASLASFAFMRGVVFRDKRRPQADPIEPVEPADRQRAGLAVKR
jgi:glycosyltransferase involved in cell wall biosynthesis/putative flippase GtrA